MTRDLPERCPSLCVTTMALTRDGLRRVRAVEVPGDEERRWQGHVLFGRDDPELPNPHAEERDVPWALDLPVEAHRKIVHDKAARLLRLDGDGRG